MSTRFVSCDTSTNNSGLALFVDGKYKKHILISKSKIKNTDERINAMCLDIFMKLDEWKPNVLWIEHPQGHGSNVAMVSKLSEILGAVRIWCVLNDCEYNEINPSEWRRYAGFTQGSAKREDLKRMSVEYIWDKLGIHEGDDVADSIALGYAVINYFKEKEKKDED